MLVFLFFFFLSEVWFEWRKERSGRKLLYQVRKRRRIRKGKEKRKNGKKERRNNPKDRREGNRKVKTKERTNERKEKKRKERRKKESSIWIDMRALLFDWREESFCSFSFVD